MKYLTEHRGCGAELGPGGVGQHGLGPWVRHIEFEVVADRLGQLKRREISIQRGRWLRRIDESARKETAMEPNELVDDFEATDQHGNTVTLCEMLDDGPVVVFFYPKAMTSGCTAESCHFRDLSAEFARYGAQPVGISADSIAQQAQFDAANSLGFPLLSDVDRRIAAQFGVKRPGPLWNRRTTFVIDRDRRIVEVIGSEMNMEIHADQALEALARVSTFAQD